MTVAPFNRLLEKRHVTVNSKDLLLAVENSRDNPCIVRMVCAKLTYTQMFDVPEVNPVLPRCVHSWKLSRIPCCYSNHSMHPKYISFLPTINKCFIDNCTRLWTTKYW